jgi:thymidylate synthase
MSIYLFVNFAMYKNHLVFLGDTEHTRALRVSRHQVFVTDDPNVESHSDRIRILIQPSDSTSHLPILDKMSESIVYSTNIEGFEKWYSRLIQSHPSQVVFISVGVEYSNYFLKQPYNNPLSPSIVFLTEHKLKVSDDSELHLVKPHEYYMLYHFSTWDEKHIPACRCLTYIKQTEPSPERQYLQLCQTVLDKGHSRMDRTQTGTLSLFGTQMRFDLKRGLPLFTTKRVAWKSCIEELLWFCRGDTDAKLLQQKGVKIWDGNSSRQFLDARGLDDYPDGILGPIYGWQWRFFGAKYQPRYGNTQLEKPSEGFDQLQHLVDQLYKDPFSRRHVISAWNPGDLSEMALPPCHYTFQFYVREQRDKKYLSCHFIMRSNDLGCGTSFNLLSYAVLTHIIALKTGMIPDELVYTCSDTHVYLNHLEALQTQLQRTPLALPKLYIHPSVEHKNWSEIQLSDFDIIGYFPESNLYFPMAV